MVFGMVDGMDGTVFYAESQGCWIARYPAGRFNTGKVIAGYGKTREKAMRNRDRALARALSGTQQRNGATVRGVLDKYMAWVEQGNDRANSIERKRDRLERYLIPYMGKPFKELNSEDVQAIIGEARRASKDSENSKIAKTMYDELEQLFSWAQQRNMIATKPTTYVIRPKYTSAARRTNELHIDERIEMGRWLLSHAAEQADTGYGMLLLASMGMRAGEIRGMEWKCFNHLLDGRLDETTVSVQQIYDRDIRTGEWKIMRHTKSNAMSYRTIAVPQVWAYNLLNFYEHMEDVHHLPYRYDGFVCLDEDGNPLTKNRQQNIWNGLKQAYIREHPTVNEEIAWGMRIHDMRHVVASVLVMNGATLEQVRPILGHMSTEMTQYYTSLSTGFNRATMNELPTLMEHGNNILNYWNLHPSDEEKMKK